MLARRFSFGFLMASVAFLPGHVVAQGVADSNVYTVSGDETGTNGDTTHLLDGGDTLHITKTGSIHITQTVQDEDPLYAVFASGGGNTLNIAERSDKDSVVLSMDIPDQYGGDALASGHKAAIGLDYRDKGMVAANVDGVVKASLRSTGDGTGSRTESGTLYAFRAWSSALDGDAVAGEVRGFGDLTFGRTARFSANLDSFFSAANAASASGARNVVYGGSLDGIAGGHVDDPILTIYGMFEGESHLHGSGGESDRFYFSKAVGLAIGEEHGFSNGRIRVIGGGVENLGGDLGRLSGRVSAGSATGFYLAQGAGSGTWEVSFEDGAVAEGFAAEEGTVSADSLGTVKGADIVRSAAGIMRVALKGEGSGFHAEGQAEHLVGLHVRAASVAPGDGDGTGKAFVDLGDGTRVSVDSTSTSAESITGVIIEGNAEVDINNKVSVNALGKAALQGVQDLPHLSVLLLDAEDEDDHLSVRLGRKALLSGVLIGDGESRAGGFARVVQLKGEGSVSLDVDGGSLQSRVKGGKLYTLDSSGVAGDAKITLKGGAVLQAESSGNFQGDQHLLIAGAVVGNAGGKHQLTIEDGSRIEMDLSLEGLPEGASARFIGIKTDQGSGSDIILRDGEVSMKAGYVDGDAVRSSMRVSAATLSAGDSLALRAGSSLHLDVAAARGEVYGVQIRGLDGEAPVRTISLSGGSEVVLQLADDVGVKTGHSLVVSAVGRDSFDPIGLSSSVANTVNISTDSQSAFRVKFAYPGYADVQLTGLQLLRGDTLSHDGLLSLDLEGFSVEDGGGNQMLAGIGVFSVSGRQLFSAVATDIKIGSSGRVEVRSIPADPNASLQSYSLGGNSLFGIYVRHGELLNFSNEGSLRVMGDNMKGIALFVPGDKEHNLSNKGVISTNFRGISYGRSFSRFGSSGTLRNDGEISVSLPDGISGGPTLGAYVVGGTPKGLTFINTGSLIGSVSDGVRAVDFYTSSSGNTLDFRAGSFVVGDMRLGSDTVVKIDTTGSSGSFLWSFTGEGEIEGGRPEVSGSHPVFYSRDGREVMVFDAGFLDRRGRLLEELSLGVSDLAVPRVLGRKGLWVSGFMSHDGVGAGEKLVGVSSQGGVAIGVDGSSVSRDSAFSFGALIGHSRGRARIEAPSSWLDLDSYEGRADGVFGAVYGGKSFDTAFVGLSLSGGFLEHSDVRFVNGNAVEGGVFSSRSHYKSYWFSPALAMNADFEAFGGWMYRPSFRFGYAYQSVDPYQEGESVSAVGYGAQTLSLLSVRAEVGLGRKFGLADLTARAGYRHVSPFGGSDYVDLSIFNQEGKVYLSEDIRGGFYGGLGVGCDLSDGLSAHFDGEVLFGGKKRVNWRAVARLQASF